MIANKLTMTPKPISTRMHGIIDYIWAGVVPLLPRFLGADPGVQRLLTLSAFGTLIYSLLTRYELAPIKLVPMRLHLAFDLIQGISLVIAGLTPKDTRSKALLLGLSLIALLVTTNTQREIPKKTA
jgi:hypothetical protein